MSRLCLVLSDSYANYCHICGVFFLLLLNLPVPVCPHFIKLHAIDVIHTVLPSQCKAGESRNTRLIPKSLPTCLSDVDERIYRKTLSWLDFADYNNTS